MCKHMLPKDMYKNVHYSIIHKSQKQETQLKYSPTVKWMNEGSNIHTMEYTTQHADEL